MSHTRLHPFAGAVGETCRRRRLLGPEDRVLAALSGGPDSTALLAALCELKAAGALGALFALHVDHQLRPESRADGDFCEDLCRQLGVPLERVAIRVGAGNLQAAARRARYDALRRQAARLGATRIATGHTRSDQAETVVLRLLRGAGARGLSGIPPRRGPLVRPLIDRSRAEVLGYLRDRGLGWREDPSNAAPRFARSRVRREVLPALEALSPAAERCIARSADLLRADDLALSARGRRAVRGRAQVALERLLREPLAVRRRAVRALWRSARGRRAGMSAHHVEAILALCRRGRPGRIALPHGLEAMSRYGVLSIAPRAGAPGRGAGEEVAVPGPGRYSVPGLAAEVQVSLRGGEAEVDWPLVLRSRRPGDRFRPAGGPGSKKLKAWFIDRKVPRERRDALVVLASRAGEVLAIPELGAAAAGLPVEVRLAREEP